MHIAIDARVINSGTGTYVYKLLENLQNIDSENQYSVLVRRKDLDYWQPRNQNFTVVEAEFDNYSFGEQIGFKLLLDRLAPDLVHFCMPQQPIFYKGKHVTTMHDMTLLKTYNSDKNWLVFHLKQVVGRIVWKYIAKTSQHIIAISENTKKEYQDFSKISDDKISVIYEAVDQPRSDLETYPVPFEKFIIYVGQQPDYKNLRRLAAAHQKLLTKHPNLGLIFVGRMNKDTELNQKFYLDNNYKNIHFTGFLNDAKRDWLYTQASAYVFPSLLEGFGLPPLEAMAYGAPVISSNASCMPEILGDAARYFDPLSVDDITQAIDDVLSDESLRQTLIDRGFEQVKKYSWQKTAQQTHAIYMAMNSSEQ